MWSRAAVARQFRYSICERQPENGMLADGGHKQNRLCVLIVAEFRDRRRDGRQQKQHNNQLSYMDSQSSGQMFHLVPPAAISLNALLALMPAIRNQVPSFYEERNLALFWRLFDNIADANL